MWRSNRGKSKVVRFLVSAEGVQEGGIITQHLHTVPFFPFGHVL